jgi:hypothetical protein
MIGARAPNHLGDGVVALPAMAALAQRGPLVIFGPRWASELYRDVPAEIRPRGAMGPLEEAVLFAPSLRAALEARHARRRIGTPTDGRRWLLTDVVPAGVHPWDTYQALVSVLGARATAPPRWTVREADPPLDVPDDHVGLNPVTASGSLREWPLFGALAARLRRPVVVGRALGRCRLFVSNDSGAAHFARACGVPVLVLYGSTAPHRTGPLGSHGLQGPQMPCAPCYGQRCHRALDCFDYTVDDVLARIEALLG